RVLATGDSFNLTYRVCRKDGRVIWVDDRGHFFRDNTDQIIRMVGFLEDITERKQAEEALRQSEERLQLAQRSARIGTWHWNLATDESTWSEGIYSLLGLEQGDGNSRLEDFVEFIHPEDRKRALDKAMSVIRRGEVYEDEFRIIRPDGALLWLISKGRVVRNA